MIKSALKYARNISQFRGYLLSVICYLLSLSAISGLQPVELLPFTFYGRIVNYAHIAYGKDTSVEVRLKDANGKLIAKTTTATGGETAYNYVLDVPLSSKTVAGHAHAGDTMTFEFVDPVGKIYYGLVASGDAVIGLSGEKRNVDVILATDADGNGIADEYEQALVYMMAVKGIEEYQPLADWDGDGMNNYQEYIAGTNPLDATDYLKITEMAAAAGYDDYLAITFLAAEGRTYMFDAGVRKEVEITDWTDARFAVGDPGAIMSRAVTTEPGASGPMTVFVKKNGENRYWRLKVK